MALINSEFYDDISHITWRAGLDPTNEADRFKAVMGLMVKNPLPPGRVSGEECDQMGLLCVRMARTERIMRERPTPKPRPVIVTAPREHEAQPDFEELLLEGLLDDAAFANRRNWGERSGKAWNDPSQGVQRDSRLRWDRGGVNRKHG